MSEAVIVIFSRSQDMLMRNLERTMINNTWKIPILMLVISGSFTGAAYWYNWETDFTTERLLSEWLTGFGAALVLVPIFSDTAWCLGYSIKFCFCIYIDDDPEPPLDDDGAQSLPVRKL